MSALSSFGLNLAAGIVLEVVKNGVQKSVKSEIDQAFEEALKAYSPNISIRAIDRAKILKVFQEMIRETNVESKEFSEYNSFFVVFEEILATKNAAYNFLKEVRDQKRYDEIINKLNQLIDNKQSSKKNLKEVSELSKVKLSPKVFHALPPAPRFVGRIKEMKFLEEFWNKSESGILSIEAIGGAGKTAIAQRFLSLRLADKSADGIFVWSFYDEPDTNLFFQKVYEYFSGNKKAKAKGYGWLHLLKEVIGSGGKYLLILDGLEKVQYEKHNYFNKHGKTDNIHAFGAIQDILLKELLKRLAAYGGNSKVIITTRFPLVDLNDWKGITYYSYNADILEVETAVNLLVKHGVKGSRRKLLDLVEDYGTHALTIDHLGNIIGRFFDGNPKEFLKSNIENIAVKGGSRQALKLASIFRKYEEILPKKEREVLGIICVFRYGISKELIIDVYNKFRKRKSESDFEIIEIVNSLVDYHLVLLDTSNNFTVHPAVREHFYQIFKSTDQIHAYASQSILTLTNRPGNRVTALSFEMLKYYEELIFHLLRSGDFQNAKSIYFDRIGGGKILADKLGEFTVGYRILSQFPEIIDYSGWLKYRVGIGDIPHDEELEVIRKNLKGVGEAHDYDSLLLLSGKLTEADGNEVSSASFLMGKEVRKIYGTYDAAPKFSAYYYSGSYDNYDNDRFGNRAILFFLSAERFRQYKEFDKAELLSEEGESLIIKSGSQIHLCIFHLINGRRYIDLKEFEKAESSIFEGLEIAKNSRFKILEIDLLLSKTKLHLKMGEYEKCSEFAMKVYNLSKCEETMYVWAAGFALYYNLTAIRREFGEKSSQFISAVNSLTLQLELFHSIPRQIIIGLENITNKKVHGLRVKEHLIIDDNFIKSKSSKLFLQEVNNVIAVARVKRLLRSNNAKNVLKARDIYLNFLSSNAINETIGGQVINHFELHEKLNISFSRRLEYITNIETLRILGEYLVKRDDKRLIALNVYDKIVGKLNERRKEDIIARFELQIMLKVDLDMEVFLSDNIDEVSFYAEYLYNLKFYDKVIVLYDHFVKRLKASWMYKHSSFKNKMYERYAVFAVAFILEGQLAESKKLILKYRGNKYFSRRCISFLNLQKEENGDANYVLQLLNEK